MWWMATTALAADWPMLQGTEPAGAEAVRPWGFAQVVGEGIVGGRPVHGLSPGLDAVEGQLPAFDRVGSGDATWGFGLRRARAGLRGVVPATGGRVNWLVALEFGDNALTRLDPVVMTDASVTWSAAPGVRLRAGQFKLPLGEEALEMNPMAAQFVNLTQATAQLLAENPVAAGAYTAGGSGFRDVGVQWFDTRPVGPGEVSYALMVSNGRMGSLELDDAKDVTGRVSVTPWVWGDPGALQRDELGAWVFHTQGRRELDGVEAARIRQGAGVKLQRSGWQLRGELLHAAGMLELGANPPFPGQGVVVAPEGRALGGYTSVHYGRGHAAGGLRYDELARSTESEPDRRVFRTLTADLQLVGSPRARLMVDYELRWLTAPGGSEDARRIAAAMGDRASVQAVAVF